MASCAWEEVVLSDAGVKRQRGLPKAYCAATLVERLTHQAEVFEIGGSSYRLREAQEHAARMSAERRSRSQRASRRPPPMSPRCRTWAPASPIRQTAPADRIAPSMKRSPPKTSPSRRPRLPSCSPRCADALARKTLCLLSPSAHCTPSYQWSASSNAHHPTPPVSSSSPRASARTTLHLRVAPTNTRQHAATRNGDADFTGIARFHAAGNKGPCDRRSGLRRRWAPAFLGDPPADRRRPGAAESGIGFACTSLGRTAKAAGERCSTTGDSSHEQRIGS